MADETIDLQKVFNVNKTVYTNYMGGKERYDDEHELDPKEDQDINNAAHIVNSKFSIFNQIVHKDEWLLYSFLEDQYNCSGICRTAIFYFSNPVDYGPPKQTCLSKFVTHVSQKSSAPATMSILTGVLALFTFFFHFLLYMRPVD